MNTGLNKWNSILPNFPTPEEMSRGDTPKAISWLEMISEDLREYNWNINYFSVNTNGLNKMEIRFIIEFLQERGWLAEFRPEHDQRDENRIVIKTPEGDF